MNRPTRIHHYTTLNTLGAILESKKIRFSTLAKVNDENEGETQDIGNLGKYIFISCWTDNPHENDWMWKEYGDNYSGIRISLEFPPFYVYDEENDPTIVPPDGIIKDNYYILPSRENFYDHMEYSKNEMDLKPKVVFNSSVMRTFMFGKVGKYKQPGKWNVEEELRFIIYVLPKKSHQGFNDLDSIISDSLNMMNENVDIGVEYIDWNIELETFRNMVITVGSEMSIKDFRILNELVDKFNISAKILKSDFPKCN